MASGGEQIPGNGTGDDGYDEDGYDESQRAEILEASGGGTSDGTIMTDLIPDLGGDEDVDNLDRHEFDTPKGGEGRNDDDDDDDGADDDDDDDDDGEDEDEAIPDDADRDS